MPTASIAASAAGIHSPTRANEERHMSVRRINPDSGVVEERSEPIDPVSDGEWKPLVNEHGTNERINQDTGVTEERGALLDDLVGSDWLPKKP
jgi:hypothetical protein